MQTETSPLRRDGLNLLLDVLTQPAKTFAYLADQSHLGLALLVHGLSQLPAALTRPWVVEPEPGVPVAAGPAEVAVNLLAGYVGLLLLTLVIHGFARLLGGRNRYSRLVQAEAISSLPLLLSAPFAALAHWAEAPVVYSLASTGMLVWSLVLSVIGIRETYRFGTARAVATLLLTVMLIFLILFGFFLLLGFVAVILG